MSTTEFTSPDSSHRSTGAARRRPQGLPVTVLVLLLGASALPDAPALAQQVIDRVNTFDFGAKEDIAAVTIIYPIDFLPAA